MDLWRGLMAGGLALGLSLVLTPAVRWLSVHRGVVTKPVRSHDLRWGRRIVARMGGVAMVAAFTPAVWSVFPVPMPVMALVLGGIATCAVGLVDDLVRMTPYAKLLCQIVLACAVIPFGVQATVFPGSLAALNIPLTVLWVVFFMNAFNLLDNMDGLAAGTAAIAAGFLAVHDLMDGDPGSAAVLLALAGAAVGFLRYNTFPAKIIMGDCGSQFLGFIIAGASLLETRGPATTHLATIMLVPVLVLLVPIFDTTFVTFMRRAHRRGIFQGGTDHVSHRLVVLGLSQRAAVGCLYAVSGYFGAMSLVSARVGPVNGLLLILVSLVLLVLLGMYLARVRVYHIQRVPVESAVPSGEEVVLDTMYLHKRRFLEVVLDLVMISGSYLAAHLLRFDGVLEPGVQEVMFRTLPVVIVTKLAMLMAFGVYGGIWRYVGLHDLLSIFAAVSAGSILSAGIGSVIWRFPGYVRSVWVLDWLIVFLGVSATRVAERVFDEYVKTHSQRAKRVLIYGAGDRGELVLRHIRSSPRLNYRPVGFLDDDPRKKGRRIHGVPILGGRQDLITLAQRAGVDELLIAVPRLSEPAWRELVAKCGELEIPARRLTEVIPGEAETPVTS